MSQVRDKDERGATSASDEGSVTVEKEGDVADETWNMNGVWESSPKQTYGRKGRKSRNTTPLLGLKTTRLHS